MQQENRAQKIFVGIFLLVGLLLLVLNFLTPTDTSIIRVIACDVGQGDAILIAQGNYQIVIDGGANSRVLDCLTANMPYTDRRIELVVMTHPQYDHYRGLIDVFERYEVENFLASGLDATASSFESFEELVTLENTNLIRPKKGLKIKVNEMVFEVLHPDTEFQQANSTVSSPDSNVLGVFTSKTDPNAFSIVAKLTFGEFDALFTGDLGPEESDSLAESGVIDDVEYLKVQHHGSKNGLSQSFFDAAAPEVAVISAGEGNRYGHPHSEILSMLKDIKVLRTDTDGEVVVVSDGEKMWVE